MSEPIVQIRFSEVSVDRLNKAMVQIYQTMQSLQAQINALSAALSSQQQAAPGYPGIENGSAAIIQGPVPGGPSPVPPYLTPHALIVGEGSTPVKLIVGTDGQIPIACSNGDPAFANIEGDGSIATPGLIAVENSCNGITIGVNGSFSDWIATVSSALAISPPG